MLLQVRDHLRRVGKSSIAELQRHFALDPVILKQMLSIWQRKGMLRCYEMAACKSCGGCFRATQEIVEWCA